MAAMFAGDVLDLVHETAAGPDAMGSEVRGRNRLLVSTLTGTLPKNALMLPLWQRVEGCEHIEFLAGEIVSS